MVGAGTESGAGMSAKPINYKRGRWSAGDDEILKRLWDVQTKESIAAQLGRTTNAVHLRASALGLTREYIRPKLRVEVSGVRVVTSDDYHTNQYRGLSAHTAERGSSTLGGSSFVAQWG